MPKADNPPFRHGQSSTDILVVGGGVMGLWAALKAARAGQRVTLIERDRLASGASGGLMGALFPWMPDRWDDKKQFQFDALVALPEEIAALEADTGLSAQFRRSGRIIPFPKPHLVPIHARLERDAEANWNQPAGKFSWSVREGAPENLALAPEFTAHGHALDTLAARVSPRALTSLIAARLAACANVTIIAAAGVARIDAVAGRAELEDGTAIAFGHALVASGVASFPLLEALLPPLPKSLGQGVKGQAALLAADLDPAAPVVFLDGLYIVPHEGGVVAVGSTSENAYADPHSTDTQLERVLERARALLPALAGAPVIERWAGVRPKAVERDPLIGPVPGHANVIALTGGFKITFGIAHRLAEAALEFASGHAPAGLPESFTLRGQLARIGVASDML
jgi:glycine oxidase